MGAVVAVVPILLEQLIPFFPHHILGGFNCREFVRDWHNATVPFIDKCIAPLQPNSISMPLATLRNLFM